MEQGTTPCPGCGIDIVGGQFCPECYSRVSATLAFCLAYAGFGCMFLGALIPSLCGTTLGPTQTQTFRFPYSGGPVYVDPWIGWLSYSMIIAGGIMLFAALMAVFVWLDSGKERKDRRGASARYVFMIPKFILASLRGIARGTPAGHGVSLRS